ncbi:hypothetical protein H9P43_006377 [Blastocladiella emersonii ATCC 22665]|nr:hypothetical protein H9P43_006377 [Blastocladiella emersonii ATCC 22665]
MAAGAASSSSTPASPMAGASGAPRTPLNRAARSYPASVASAAGTPLGSPAMSPNNPPLSVAAAAANALPSVPGYEMAQLHTETFIQCPHAMPKGSPGAATIKRKKSLFRRKSQRYQLQAEVQVQGDEQQAAAASSSSSTPANGQPAERNGPEEIMGPQVEAVLAFLNKELLLKPAAYSHALFSFAFDGVAEAVEERRSVMWIAQPLIVTDEIAPMVDTEADWSDAELLPPTPWTVDFESCLPATFESTFEVSLEVPNTNFYRTCFYCEGRGTCRCTACSGNSLILCKPCKSTGVTKSGAMCDNCQGLGCKTCEKCRNSGRHQCPVCQGHGHLRIFLLLRAVWQRHVTRLVDSNGYPLQPDSPMGDLLAEVDAAYAATNANALPADLDASTATEVVGFSETLRTQIARTMHPTAWVRSFAYNIRVIPLFEMVYIKRKVFLKKKKARYLVYGNSVQGVLRMGENARAQASAASK